MKSFVVISMMFISFLAFGQFVLAANDDYAITQIHVFTKFNGEAYYDYEYNDNGLMIRETESPASGNKIMFEFEYDTNNNLVRRTNKQFVNGNWENTLRLNYFYENNKLSLRTSEKWDVDAFKDYMKLYYEYNDDGKVKYEKMEELIAGEWIKKYDLTYSYYVDYYQIIWYAYSNGNISSGARWRYEYNELGLIGKEYQDGWYINDWVPAYRTTNYYWQSTSRFAQYITEQYTDDKWTNFLKVEYGYNFNDDLASQTNYGYRDSIWEKSLMRDYQYDSLRNLVVTTCNIWNIDSWDILDNTVNIKFTLGNIEYLRYLNGYRFEFSYDKIVSVDENQITGTIYPNPATDFIEINLTGLGVNPSVNEDVKIYNFLGEIVLNDIVTPPDPLSRGGVTRIDISGLVPGVYFVRLGNSVQRFVKY